MYIEVCVAWCVDLSLAVCVCAVLTRVDRGCELACVVYMCVCSSPSVEDPRAILKPAWLYSFKKS